MARKKVTMDNESRLFAFAMAEEIARTQRGHWHPEYDTKGNAIQCNSSCPMGDPKSAPIFRAQLEWAKRMLIG